MMRHPVGATTRNHQILPCPACREYGKDTDGDNLAVFPSGAFHCIAVGKDRQHNRRILELMPELKTEGRKSMPARKRESPLRPPVPPPDLLTRILTKYPATLIDLSEESPIRCDENLDEARQFLQLFPADAVLWIAPDLFQTGEPEHARYFRPRAEWQNETFTTPGTRIAPACFHPGSYRRTQDSVREHLFVVIESDEIGEGKLYRTKDHFCRLLAWLRHASHWHLAAVVDTGNKSLHAWFRHPGQADLNRLAGYAAALGLDSKFREPSQPWRLPGVPRENSERRQHLVYLNLEETL